MMLAALAGVAAAAAAAQSPGGSVVSPLTVRPPPASAPPAATVDVPSDSNGMGIWASVWPADALARRISGRVVLGCGIDRYGLAEWCKVVSETPPNRGFGAAALELRPTFKVKPATGPDGPIEAVMNIAVDFKAPDRQADFGSGREGGSTQGGMSGSANGFSDVSTGGGPSLTPRRISMLNNPVWASTVSHDELAKAYPAKAGGGEGYAVAHCEVAHDGALSGCQVIKEAPENRGFGEAALRLASRFKVARDWTTAPNHADIWVDIPIRFPAPGAEVNRTVASPYWVAGFSPAQALKVFPPEAAAKGLDSGFGAARCVVTRDGSLSDCTPQPADPEGLGFSEAAVKLAATMRMNPWTTDGSPVDGDVVDVSVKLELKPGS